MSRGLSNIVREQVSVDDTGPCGDGEPDLRASGAVATDSLYEQLLKGCAAPSGGGKIDTRAGVVDTETLFARIDAAASLIGQTAHPYIGVDAEGPVGFLVALYACSKAGRVCVPINSNDPQRMKFIMETLAIDLVMDGEAARRSQVDAGAQRAVLSKYDEALVADTIVLLFTSGTTSHRSKGVFMGERGIAFICERMNEAMSINHTAREYMLAGIDHAFGFGRCHSVLMAGGELVLPQTLDVRELFLQFERRECRGLSIVPSLLSVVLDQVNSLADSPFANLQYVQSGAMRFSSAYRQKLAANKHVRAYLHYGLTEAMRAAFLDVQKFPDKLMTEGRPFAGVELTIQDANGSVLPVGSVGEVCLRGASLALGYTDMARWNGVLRDGWFRTGDMGRLDSEGFLTYEGRSADSMNINGNLVYPDDVEERLLSIFGSIPFSVFGVADPKGIKDDLLFVAYEGDPGAIDPVDCVKQLKQLGFSVSSEGIVAIDKLPRNKTGKVQRFLLRQRFGSQAT